MAVRGDRIVALGSSADIRRYVGPATAGRRPAGAARHPGIHRRARPLHTASGRAAAAEADEDDELGRDRVDGRRRRRRRAKPGEWIYRPRLAPGEMDVAAGPERRGLSRRTRRSTRCRRTTRCSSRTRAATPASPTPRRWQLSGISTGPRRTRRAEKSSRTRRATPPACCARRASGLIRAASASRRRRRRRRWRAAAGCSSWRRRKSLSKGITTFQDAGSSFADDRSDEADGGRREDGRPAVGHGPREQRGARAEAREVPDGRLRQRAPDRARDQAVDRRRARLARRVAARAVLRQAGQRRAQYDDASTTSPRPRGSPCQHDYQLCVHAIGDRANRETLNIFERAFKANPAKRDLRWRVEHAQHLSAAGHPALRPAWRDRVDAGRSTARRTRRTCSSGSARSGPKKARTSGRS